MTQSEIVRLPWTGESWSEADAEFLAPYGRRSFWWPNFNEKLGVWFVIADEDNNEAFNVYRFAPGDEGSDFLWRCAPIPSEEALEEMQVLEDMREDCLNVFHQAMVAAVCPTDENKRHIQSLFDLAREHLWSRAVELRGNGEECEGE